jgi:CBS domain-containing protein
MLAAFIPDEERAMQVRDIMTPDPTCCSADASIEKAARQMAENDCGSIPVLDEQLRPIGIITDRDITCRAVAEGLGPETSVSDIMSEKVVCVRPQDSIEECYRRMEDDQIRRILVVDDNRAICGIVAQGDLVREIENDDRNSELLRDISQPNNAPSMRH